jgi:transcriptional regulator with XRE-family HTH domain
MSKIQINGSTLRLIRELKGIPHGKFALKVGISPSYLTNIEAGRKQPAPDVMHSIAKALDINVWEITYTLPDMAVAA